jgi:hypothetical protein
MSKENSGGLEVIQPFANGSTLFSITGTFKGIPISQKIKLLSIEQDLAIFQSTDIKVFAPAVGTVSIQCEAVFGFITARLQEYNSHSRKFILTDFRFYPSPRVERTMDRVHPEAPTYVTIHSNRKVTQGCIEDVNSIGMSILSKNTPLVLEILTPGKDIKIDYRLPINNFKMILGGKVVYFYPIQHALSKIGIELHLTSQQAHYLNRYVNFRKQMILQEIEQSYFRACGPRRVEDLYF